MKCACVWLGVGVSRLGLGFTNPVETGGVWDLYLCLGCGGVGGVEGNGWMAWSRVWEGVVVLCLCVLRIWILCGDGRSRYMCIVLVQTFLGVVGSGLVSTSPAFMRSSANHSASPHGGLSKKHGKSIPHRGRGRHNLHIVSETDVTVPPRSCCVAWCKSSFHHHHRVIKSSFSIVPRIVFQHH